MSSSVVVAAIGFYQEEVQYFAAIVVSFGGFGVIGVYVWVRVSSKKFMESYWIKRGSKRKDSLIENATSII